MHKAIGLNDAFRKGLYKNEPSFFVTVITLKFMILYGHSQEKRKVIFYRISPYILFLAHHAPAIRKYLK